MIEGIYLQNNIKTGFANHAEKQNQKQFINIRNIKR